MLYTPLEHTVLKVTEITPSEKKNKKKTKTKVKQSKTKQKQKQKQKQTQQTKKIRITTLCIFGCNVNFSQYLISIFPIF